MLVVVVSRLRGSRELVVVLVMVEEVGAPLYELNLYM